jgi:hypothetical protein
MREDADTTDDSIVRADTRSCVRTSAAKREQILAEFERSGLSGARFARLDGINCQTLMAWTCKGRVSTSPGVSAAGSAVDLVGGIPAECWTGEGAAEEPGRQAVAHGIHGKHGKNREALGEAPSVAVPKPQVFPASRPSGPGHLMASGVPPYALGF